MQNASFYFHCSMQSSSTNREYLDTIIVIWGCMWTNKEKHTHWLGINVLSSKPPTNINMSLTHTNTYAYQDYMNNKKYTHTQRNTCNYISLRFIDLPYCTGYDDDSFHWWKMDIVLRSIVIEFDHYKYCDLNYHQRILIIKSLIIGFLNTSKVILQSITFIKCNVSVFCATETWIFEV